jgi:hypothetical protein
VAVQIVSHKFRHTVDSMWVGGSWTIAAESFLGWLSQASVTACVCFDQLVLVHHSHLLSYSRRDFIAIGFWQTLLSYKPYKEHELGSRDNSVLDLSS